MYYICVGSYDLVHEATTSSMPVSVIPSPTPTGKVYSNDWMILL